MHQKSNSGKISPLSLAEFAQRVVKVKDLHFSNVTEKKTTTKKQNSLMYSNMAEQNSN